eukprot:TRINITY_DN344_c0_g2_i1.p1 TRINITY_DN344_c0_g2~~TRINITY_DN344_c0_g2_i1.p1  ORF type:complete len:775 (-),score=184.88 TRINITY_DN344_c0_g2_i1:126-2450(-)
MTNYKAIPDSTTIPELLEILGQKYPEGTLPEEASLRILSQNQIHTVKDLHQCKASRILKLELPVLIERELINLITNNNQPAMKSTGSAGHIPSTSKEHIHIHNSSAQKKVKTLSREPSRSKRNPKSKRENSSSTSNATSSSNPAIPTNSSSGNTTQIAISSSSYSQSSDNHATIHNNVDDDVSTSEVNLNSGSKEKMGDISIFRELTFTIQDVRGPFSSKSTPALYLQVVSPSGEEHRASTSIIGGRGGTGTGSGGSGVSGSGGGGSGSLNSGTSSPLTSHNPLGSSVFVFSNVQLYESFYVKLYESKKKKSDKCIGIAEIRIDELTPNSRTEEKRFFQSVAKETSGNLLGIPKLSSSPSSNTSPSLSSLPKLTDIEFSMKYELRELVVLTKDHYEDLIKLLIDDPKLRIIELLGKVVASFELKISKHIVHLFDYYDKAFVYLEKVLEMEIEECDDTATLFRGDTLSIEAFDYYLNYIGKEYLVRTLKPHIEVIVQEKLDCELEERKLDRAANLQNNFNNYMKYAKAITDTIFNSVDDVPIEFHYLFHYLQKTATQKFPYKVEVSLTAINGFLFLRFFVPAIMNPEAAGVWNSSSLPPLDAKTLSTLSLLARSLQKMANITSFSRDREPHLHLINEFLKGGSKKLALFVGKIADQELSKDRLASITKRDKSKLNIALDLSSLIFVINKHIDYFKKFSQDPDVAQLLKIIEKINKECSKVSLKPPSSNSTPVTRRFRSGSIGNSSTTEDGAAESSAGSHTSGKKSSKHKKKTSNS